MVNPSRRKVLKVPIPVPDARSSPQVQPLRQGGGREVEMVNVWLFSQALKEGWSKNEQSDYSLALGIPLGIQ